MDVCVAVRMDAHMGSVVCFPFWKVNFPFWERRFTSQPRALFTSLSGRR
jgi:hypothetical protein